MNSEEKIEMMKKARKVRKGESSSSYDGELEWMKLAAGEELIKPREMKKESHPALDFEYRARAATSSSIHDEQLFGRSSKKSSWVNAQLGIKSKNFLEEDEASSTSCSTSWCLNNKKDVSVHTVKTTKTTTSTTRRKQHEQQGKKKSSSNKLNFKPPWRGASSAGAGTTASSSRNINKPLLTKKSSTMMNNKEQYIDKTASPIIFEPEDDTDYVYTKKQKSSTVNKKIMERGSLISTNNMIKVSEEQPVGKKMISKSGNNMMASGKNSNVQEEVENNKASTADLIMRGRSSSFAYSTVASRSKSQDAWEKRQRKKNDKDVRSPTHRILQRARTFVQQNNNYLIKKSSSSSSSSTSHNKGAEFLTSENHAQTASPFLSSSSDNHQPMIYLTEPIYLSSGDYNDHQHDTTTTSVAKRTSSVKKNPEKKLSSTSTVVAKNKPHTSVVGRGKGASSSAALEARSKSSTSDSKTKNSEKQNKEVGGGKASTAVENFSGKSYYKNTQVPNKTSGQPVISEIKQVSNKKAVETSEKSNFFKMKVVEKNEIPMMSSRANSKDTPTVNKPVKNKNIASSLAFSSSSSTSETNKNKQVKKMNNSSFNNGAARRAQLVLPLRGRQEIYFTEEKLYFS